ncbi:MAG: hypothetical protein A2W19_03810 [Spirochaetes bacterium RBG_16_49_21]|nr:MAG: hypothetical protein A2W19_03810 [Spirochaetes bacterium RBG_16_49_21]
MMHLVFTDVDGTLLDHDTYRYDAALEGISILHEKGIPLILVSSKTLPEMSILHHELALSTPYIFENGGGIVWSGENDFVERSGRDVSELKERLPLLVEALGEDVELVTDMDIDRIVQSTGLSPERARLVRQRRFSLPFILPSGRKIGGAELEDLNRHLQPAGYTVTKGGRFFHFLSIDADKGGAVKKVIEYYRKKCGDAVKMIGIGDSENDLPMLEAVDLPVVVKRREGSHIRTGLPNVYETKEVGPSGFTEAIKFIFKGNHPAI